MNPARNEDRAVLRHSQDCAIAVERYSAVMVLVYGDESMDETQERVCAAAAIVGTEDQWSTLESRWLERTGGIPFHANDCDSDKGVYVDTTHKNNKALYKDVTILLADSGLWGFGSSIDLRAQKRVFDLMPMHQTYYTVFTHVLEAMRNYAEVHDDMAEITFDSRVESEYNAALVYANLREERPEWKERLASKLSFESSADNPRIQAADLFAREAMKDLDNVIGPVKRKIRGAWKTLRDTNRFHVVSYSHDWFNELERDMTNIIHSAGFSKSDYSDWLKTHKREHNVTAYIEFFPWHQSSK